MKIDPEQAKQFRALYSSIISQMSGMELDEPLKSQFAAIKQQCSALLEEMPLMDAVGAAQECKWSLSSLHSCMMSLQSAFGLVGASMKGLQSRMSAQAAEMPAAIAEAIKEKISAGELVAKDTVASLCSESKSQGLAEGEKKVRDEIKLAQEKQKLVAARKDALTKASLPLPENDAFIEGTDDAFAALQTKAAERVAKLRKAGLSLNSPLLAKAFLPDGDFETFLGLSSELLGKKAGDEAFATEPGGATQTRNVSVPV